MYWMYKPSKLCWGVRTCSIRYCPAQPQPYLQALLKLFKSFFSFFLVWFVGFFSPLVCFAELFISREFMLQLSRMFHSVNLHCEKPSTQFTHSKKKTKNTKALLLVLSLKWKKNEVWGLVFSETRQSDAQRLQFLWVIGWREQWWSAEKSHFPEIAHFKTRFLKEGGWISIKERISPQRCLCYK